MKIGVNFKELKDIEKRILKGINLKDSFDSARTIAGFDIAYIGKKFTCVGVVIDIETKEEIEKKTVEDEEIMPYSPAMSTFREGPPIIEVYRELENKPDIIVVKGIGAVSPNRVGLASYVGVILNKSCIGAAKELLYGRLDEDKIIFNNEIKGIAVKTKPFANPIFISPGHNISLDSSVNIIKKVIDEQYKLPLPLHLAHKYANKTKSSIKLEVK